MTPAEKYRNVYSPEQEDLLIRLRSLDPPMPWAEIAAKHFPDRTAGALKVKVYSMPRRPPPCRVGRAPGCDNSKNTPSDSAWEDRAEAATQSLGLKIEEWFDRHNMPPAMRRWLLTGPTVLPKRIAA